MDGRSLLLAALVAPLFAGCGSGGGSPTDSYGELPDISLFAASPSDRFVVDVATVDAGLPFKGGRAAQPHAGAHAHWDNTSGAWPVGGTAPSNYPAIYAVADGVVARVEPFYPVEANHRYGVAIAFARSGGRAVLLAYSIEPMIPGDAEFYAPFIRVTEGQRVRKGDVIAYQYVAPGMGIATHLHFHLQRDGSNDFMAPALFTPAVVAAFQARWGTFGSDAGTPMPGCMGYMLDAAENPFGTGPADAL